MIEHYIYCNNTECGYYYQTRVVTPVHLGQGVYQTGPLVCQCGWPLIDAPTPPVEEPPPAEEPPSGE